MMIKGCQISPIPGEDDYIVTVGKKKYRCHSIRGCFKAANGRWPKNQKEIDRFIHIVVYGDKS